MYEKGALLKWEKPEDDGGIPIKEYVVEKMDTGTGRWSSLSANRLKGLTHLSIRFELR